MYTYHVLSSGDVAISVRMQERWTDSERLVGMLQGLCFGGPWARFLLYKPDGAGLLELWYYLWHVSLEPCSWIWSDRVCLASSISSTKLWWLSNWIRHQVGSWYLTDPIDVLLSHVILDPSDLNPKLSDLCMTSNFSPWETLIAM